MKPRPQPPEPRVLHDAADPASVLREAEVPYGSADDAGLTAATTRFLRNLETCGIPHLLVGAMAMLQHIDGRLKQLQSHLPPSDLNALHDVLTDILARLDQANRFATDNPEA